MIGLMRLSGVPTRKHPYHPFPVHSLGGVFPVTSFNLREDNYRYFVSLINAAGWVLIS